MHYKAFAALSFIVTFITFAMTVQPNVPFWDCGEFTASAIWQQVPHPPGAPLFLMIGRLFYLLIPFGDPGWRVNMVSVVASSFSSFFLFLITAKVIEAFRGKDYKSLGEALAVYGSAFIGAIAFTFSDTNWFNSVESEVYASSTVFVAFIIWLIMRWYEEFDKPGHERYVLVIVYFIGLSSGVHLLSILTIFSFVTLVYYKKYRYTLPTFLLTGIVGVVIFIAIYPGIIKWLPAMLASHMPFRNDCREYLVENEPFVKVMAIGFILLAALGLVIGFIKKIHFLNLVCLSFLLVIVGYSTYTQVLIRSHANPPMNENEPKNFYKLAAYLGREQYGDAPTWPRRYQRDQEFIAHYNEVVNGNSRDSLYGSWHEPSQVIVHCKEGDGRDYKFKNVNTLAELKYLWKYQIDHMFLRYMFWNYVGRVSDVQDAESAFLSTKNSKDVEALNFNSGYASEFPVRFFAIPLLFGIFGLIFHFYRDPKMAFVYLVMFFVMGALAAFAQNQQNPQPRERDYFYCGAFLVWCLWIGMGAFGIIEWLTKQKFQTAMTSGLITLSLIVVPINMAVGGWKIHSRAGNYIPFDYSYNILQSVEQDAILFTNGDNDTFPLWYLQDVEGVRRDVRIVNLSLANTLTYVDQLKNRSPWGAKAIPLSFADDSLQVEDEASEKALRYDYSPPQKISISVDKAILAKYTKDPDVINKGVFEWTFTGKQMGKNKTGDAVHLFMVRDKVVADILKQIRFTRPVYYSATVGPDAFCGLEPFFRAEGMAMRICPVPQNNGKGNSVDAEIMDKCFSNIDNSDNFSKEFKYGFKFRNLNNMGIYYDEVHRRLMRSYRSKFMDYADYLMNKEKNPQKAIQIIDKMNEMISPTQFPLTFEFEHKLARFYKNAGNMEKAKDFAQLGINTCTKIIESDNIMREYVEYEVMGRYYGPYRTCSYLYEMLGDYNNARNVLAKFDELCISYLKSSQGQNYAQTIYENIFDVRMNIDNLKITEAKASKGNDAALALAKQMKQQYDSLNVNDEIQMGLKAQLSMMLDRKILELQGKVDTSAYAKMMQEAIE